MNSVVSTVLTCNVQVFVPTNVFPLYVWHVIVTFPLVAFENWSANEYGGVQSTLSATPLSLPILPLALPIEYVIVCLNDVFL